jgi:hypothetical protein
MAVELQRRAGNSALARHLAQRHGGVVPGGLRLARVIGFGALAGATVPGGPVLGPAAGFGFYRVMQGMPPRVRRPAWVGYWALNKPAAGAGLERNHIVSYLLIAEALTNGMRAVYAAAVAHRAAAAGAAKAAAKAVLAARIAELTAITESLFPGVATMAGHAPMVARRNGLLNAIKVVHNYGAPTKAERDAMSLWATRLESSLMSARENVRVDNAAMNKAIGQHLDPILSPELARFQGVGKVQKMPAGILAPPGWAGATISVPAKPPLAAGAYFYTMPRAANDIAYRFADAANAYLGNDVDVLCNAAGAPIAGYPANAPLSSGPLPPHAKGQPLLVFDPAGVLLPHRYG